MMSASGNPQRSDAQRNHEKVLEAAIKELALDPEVPMSVIAKRAGVGQGTLYRHFPNRGSLVLAVYQREVGQVVASAAELLAHFDPDVALREWMSRLAAFAMVKSGLAEAFDQAGRPAGAASPAYGPVRDAVESLLAANREAGTIRADFTTGDFLLAVAGIWQIDPHGDWQSQAGRLLDLIMAGLRPPAAIPWPTSTPC